MSDQRDPADFDPPDADRRTIAERDEEQQRRSAIDRDLELEAEAPEADVVEQHTPPDADDEGRGHPSDDPEAPDADSIEQSQRP